MAVDMAKRRASRLRWYHANKEASAILNKKWHAAHPDHAAKVYAANAEKLKERSRLYRKSNRDMCRKKTADWKRANSEACAATQNKRRSRHAAGGSYSADDWQAVLQAYGHRCRNCGDAGRLTVDHAVPLSRGGLNTIENLQPLCLRCNCSKHTREWKHLG